MHRTGNEARRGVRAGFSLAELMIALVILGLGLLFIATAIPVGVEYARRSVEKADALDAADAAFEVLTSKLRTSDGLVLTSGTGAVVSRSDGLVRPRYLHAASGTVRANELYEPIIKVRPVPMRNINATGGGSPRGGQVGEPVEGAIRNFLFLSGTLSTWNPPTYSTTVPPEFATAINQGWRQFPNEINPYLGIGGGYLGFAVAANEIDGGFIPGNIPALPQLIGTNISPTSNPYPIGVFSPLGLFERFYPPIQPVTTYTTDDFFANRDNYRRTLARRIPPAARANQPGPPPGYPAPSGGSTADYWYNVYDSETAQGFDRLLSWTAFYRRVSYPEWRVVPHPLQPAWYTNNVYPVFDSNDPTLYELIVVVARRPTVTHRYPLQAGQSETSRTGRAMHEFPRALAPDAATSMFGADRLAPTPWLVTMRELPSISINVDYQIDLFTGMRYLAANFRDRPTLVFRCSGLVAQLCPPGSVLIPARNDYRPSGIDVLNGGPVQAAGFVPSARDTLPIYRVIEQRPPGNPNADLDSSNPQDEWELLVEGNGYYPWVGIAANAARQNAHQLPFWIIPPTFEERYANADLDPVYDARSPVLEVQRRIVRIPKVPDRYMP